METSTGGTRGGEGHRVRSRREFFGTLTSILMAAGLAASVVGTQPASGAGKPPKTLQPGVLKVAFNADMPMTSWKDGKLIGTDGELLSLIAERLGLKIEPHQMEWAAEIESVKAKRVDIMLGAMGWIKPRTEIMLLTDPIYYFGTLLVQKDTNRWHTFADMAGKTVCTVTGFTLVPELKKVPGIKEVKLFDTTDACLRDVVAGRVEIGILDPPLIQYVMQRNPDWHLHQVALDPEIDKFPIMSTKYNIIMGINQDNKELHAAINKEIARVWAQCENKKFMAKYGLTDPSWFIPPEPNPRVGVDRPKGWKSPTPAKSCP